MIRIKQGRGDSLKSFTPATKYLEKCSFSTAKYVSLCCYFPELDAVTTVCI